jgi:predicted transcriptional regulator
MKRTTSFKLSDMTLRQIKELQDALKMSQTELLAIAIDRMYREEIKMSKLTQDEQEQAAQIARFVIESGRVVATDGNIEPASLEVEVSFEASERGIDSATAAAMGEYIAQNV